MLNIPVVGQEEGEYRKGRGCVDQIFAILADGGESLFVCYQ